LLLVAQPGHCGSEDQRDVIARAYSNGVMATFRGSINVPVQQLKEG
jgi:hypothetical protein